LEASVDLRNYLRNVLTPLNEMERILDILAVAVPEAERLGDYARAGWLSSGIANTLLGIGENRRAVEEGLRALDLADRVQEVALRAVTFYRLGASHYTLGNFGQAQECLREGLRWAAGDRVVHLPMGTTSIPGVISRSWLAMSESETGNFPEAVQLAGEAVRLAPTDQPFSRYPALWALGHVLLRRGDLDQAASALEEGLEIGRTSSILNWYPLCAATLGHVLTLTGQHAKGLTLLEDAAHRGSTPRIHLHHALRIAWLGEAYLHAGRVDEARSRSVEALDRAVAYGERGHEAWILRLHGDIAAYPSSSDVQAAQRHYRQALELAGSLGMRPLVAHCHLALGRLHRGGGDSGQAEQHLVRALAMYREMEVPRWLDKVQQELE
jgi:tetratricopeptide (TPR) repeat protein